jgi:hypothetical protein
MLELPLKPLLHIAFVTNWPSFFSSDIPLIFSVCSVIPLLPVGLCVCKVLFFKEEEDFLFFYRVGKASSFANFGLRVGI